jgi:hypothetical protein
MRPLSKALSFLSSFIFLASFAYGGTITGIVKGPDGGPFEGAFVQGQNAKTRMTIHVLSDKNGRYRLQNLPAGEYELRIRAMGYKADPSSGVNLTSDQNIALDFAQMQRGGCGLPRPQITRSATFTWPNQPNGRASKHLGEAHTRVLTTCHRSSPWLRDARQTTREAFHFGPPTHTAAIRVECARLRNLVAGPIHLRTQRDRLPWSESLPGGILRPLGTGHVSKTARVFGHLRGRRAVQTGLTPSAGHAGNATRV